MMQFTKRNYLERKNYLEIIDAIKESLKAGGGKTSFLVYGSLIKDTFNPGISDIDGIVYFDEQFVINKERMREINQRFLSLTRRLPIIPDLDISVVDSGNARDGRFMSYSENISCIFDSEKYSTIVYGDNFRGRINPKKSFYPTELRLGTNLESVRKQLLFGDIEKKESMAKTFNCLNSLRRIGVKVCDLVEEKHVEKKEGLEYLVEKFGIDYEPFFALEEVFGNISTLIPFLYNFEKSRKLLEDCVECYEQTLQAIVKKYPAKSK